ncbi:hypothetical protein [Streptomyces sp. NPDC057460]|uniref:hypothetical protein n=1 Tax=Streptomyces sp. NPDC057460 TaxID=3346141 RepID=UPI0036ACF2BB
MLANRNLDWMSSARALRAVSGLYVSASTIGGVGHGRVKLTRDLPADFAVVLGIPVGDLAAMAALSARSVPSWASGSSGSTQPGPTWLN